LLFGKHEKELSGAEPHTTNNRMELTAAVQALNALAQPCRVDFYTDSEYLRRGITEWLPDWRRRGWKRKSGKLANIDLWQALESSLREHDIGWHWVRGHAGNLHNQRADSLARKAMRNSHMRNSP
jgi:ribonuclease HI